jgi:hypothetical protein
MDKVYFLSIAFIAIFFTSCKGKKDTIKEHNQAMRSEEALSRLDSLRISDSSSDYIENILISPYSSIFNKKEAEIARKAVIKKLIEKNIIDDNSSGIESINIDSYDARDSCYRFSVNAPSADENLRMVVIGWWEYFPRTKKVVNGITFEELK